MELTQVTTEEALSTGEFRMVNKYLKKNYPFIVRLVINESRINSVRTVPLIVHINLQELSEFYNKDIVRWAKWFLYHEKRVCDSIFVTSMLEIPPDEGSKHTAEMNDMLYSIHESIALPDEYKLPEGRFFQISEFHALPADNPTPKNIDYGF